MCRDNKTNTKKDFYDPPETGWSTRTGLNQTNLPVLCWPRGKQLNKHHKLEKRRCRQSPLQEQHSRATSQAPAAHISYGEPPDPIITWLAALPPT